MVDVVETAGGLRVSGMLDVRSVSEVRTALYRVLEGSTGDIAIDLSSLDALDATGLAVIVAAHRRALAQGRQLVLHGVRPSLARVLAVTRLNRVLVVNRASASGSTAA